jgi:uncharacterized protein (DUF433 family)
MNWKTRITVDPDVLSGKPIIRGTRISVELILDRIANGWVTEDILAAYPHLSPEDVLAVRNIQPKHSLKSSIPSKTQ